MTHTYKRCSHCGDRYTYQGSGHGCGEPLNDPDYCPGCKEAVLAALRAVPRRFVPKWRGVQETTQAKDVTLSLVLRWEQELEKSFADAKPSPTNPFAGLPIRRIFPGLVDLGTGASQNRRLVPGGKGTKYERMGFQVATWTDMREDFSIEIEMEFDLVKNDFTGQLWK